jgi:gliding motility-associated-like protein
LIDIPAQDLVVECDGAGNETEYNTWLSNNGGASATEDCGTISWSYNVNPMTNECAQTGLTNVTFVAVDQCGNTSTSSANFTIVDTTPPSFTNVPESINVECDAIPSLVLPDIADACDNDISVSHSDAILTGSCPQTYTILRTFSAVDACGNSSSAIQEINIVDTTPPVLANVPSDVTFECSNVPELGNPVTVTDNCDPNVSLQYEEQTIPGDCSQSFTRIRTWVATDACGNITEESQNIFVQDITAPLVLSPPTDLNIDCGAVAPPAEALIVVDNCDPNPEVIFEETNTLATFDCTDSYVIERTWNVQDDCGNSTIVTQTITVAGDPEPPVLVGVPNNVTYECSEVPVLTNNVAATDNCDNNVEIVYDEIIIPSSCSEGYTMSRTWIATDDCGNSAFAEQVITVEDTTPPVMSNVPMDIVITCGALPPTAPNVLATDNCDPNVIVSFNETSTINNPDCTDDYVITRSWTATDACGNSASAEQIVTIEGDSELPTLVGVPADVTYECSSISEFSNSVTATDNCDSSVDLTFDEIIISGDCPHSYIIERTWMAIDDCGNSNAATQLVTIEDTTGPILFNVPTDEYIACGETPTEAPNIFASDNCDPNVQVLFAETSTLPDADCTNNYVITRTWSATDACGNSSVAEQIITVEGDATLPVLVGVPSDIIYECSEVPTLTNTVTATDNCDSNVEIAYDEIIIPSSCSEGYTMSRTWIATDDCGNSAIAIQVITVEDTTPPVMSNVPTDIVVTCGNLPPVAASVLATDNCDPNVIVSFNETSTINNPDCTDDYVITRTWTATDACGNSSRGEQIIEVFGDNELPVLSDIPADITVDCIDNNSAIPNVFATDNCDPNISVTFTEDRIAGDCPQSFVLIRTWMAEDLCGNSVSGSQSISISDSEAPILTGVPLDISLDCSEDFVNVPPVVFATDNCDPNVFIEYAENTIPGSCAGSFEMVRTWRATDACGNETVNEQIVIVGDNEAPVFENVPADLTIDCAGIPELPAPNVIDNCDGVTDIEFEQERVDGDCDHSYTIIRTWSSTDNCGNQSQVSQSIFISDTTPPLLLGVPADITVDLTAGDIIPEIPTLSSFDICDLSSTVTVEEIVSEGCTYEIRRIFTAVDACFNETVQVQVITVIDDLEMEVEFAKDVLCTNEFSSFRASVSDSTLNYIWTSDGGEIINPESNDMIFSADQAGVYMITLHMNSEDCTAIAEMQITVTDYDDVTINSNDPTCSGDIFTIEVEGGAAWEWSGPNGFTSIDQTVTIPNTSPLQNGVYSVIVSSVGGCTQTYETILNVSEELIPDASTNSPICEGSTLELFAEGGTIYQWSGPNGYTSSEQNPVIVNLDLEPGVYFFEVNVSTLSGCNGTAMLNVEVLEAGDISTVDSIVVCIGEPVELGVNGGTDYVWSGPNNFTSTEQFPVISNTSIDNTGDYIVTVSTTFGCEVIKYINVVVESCGCDLGAEISLTESENCDSADGTAVLTPSELNFLWPDLVVASVREDLADGTYLVTASDGAGCEEIITVFIDEVGDCADCIEPLISDKLIESASCDANNGSITLEMADDQSNYSFDWSANNGTIGLGAHNIENLQAGMYFVTITDSRYPDCPIIEEILISNVNGESPAEVIIENPNCGNNDGSITLLPDTLNYFWPDLMLSSNIRESLAAGDYVVEVTNPAEPACVNYINISVGEEGGIMANVEILSESECGSATGVVQISAENVQANNIVWNDNFIGAERDSLSAGIYSVVLTNDIGCIDTITFTLENIVDDFNLHIDSVVNISCVGNTNGEVYFTTTPSITPGGDYTAYIEDANGNRLMNGDLPAGQYCVVVRDEQDCIAGLECFEVTDVTQLEVIVEVIDGDCAEIEGAINLIVSGGTAPYAYIWEDLGSTATTLGYRDDLMEGVYQATVVDANGCTLEISDVEVTDCVILIETLVDTIYTTTYPGDPVIVCLDTTLIGNIATVIEECDDPSFGSYTILDDNCIEYTPDASMMLDDVEEFCLKICDDQGTCLSTTIFVNLLPDCIGGLDIFTEETVVLESYDCGSDTEYCLDVPMTSIDSFIFLDNNIQVAQTVGCSYDSVYLYAFFSVPDQGQGGPYTLSSWSVNDQIYSGEFNSIQELVDLMNAWDSASNWEIDSTNMAIIGGSSTNSYKDLKIRQVDSGISATININSMYVPFAVALELTPGDHQITVINAYTGCADTVDVIVSCEDIVTTPDTISIFMEVGQDTVICVDQSELSSEVISILNYCEDISTEVVNYDIDEDCINITAEFIGDDIGCFVYCDDNDICDTLVVFSIVVVEGGSSGPIAVDDDTTTLVNWHVFKFDIMANDTFNLETDSLVILSSPENGTLRVNDNGTIDYIPDADFCGELDSFDYMISGPFGSSVATVTIDVLCEDLTIFNGFSPNGDGINDTFTITGIEFFANNRVLIFNRWGNQVFYAQGYANTWRGTWENRPLPDGTYFYVVDDGEGNKYSGYVQINR